MSPGFHGDIEQEWSNFHLLIEVYKQWESDSRLLYEVIEQLYSNSCLPIGVCVTKSRFIFRRSFRRF